MFTFQLLEGRHCEGRGDTRKVYVRGDIIETEKPLDTMFNSQGSIKFQRIQDRNNPQSIATEVVTPSPGDGLAGETMAELRQRAEALELDVPKNASKAYLVDLIRDATS